MKCFSVNSKDLLEKSKNPNLSLSVRDIANNPNIPKTPIAAPVAVVAIPSPTVKTRQVISESSGRPVANQFIITTEEGRYFQSYGSLIVFVPFKGNIIYLDENKWDYSTTTGRYRNQFLCENIRETRKKIKLGEYQLVNLN